MNNLKLLHAIIESAIDGIITIDSSGNIETMNPAALKLFGYKPDEVTGQNVCILIPEPDRSSHDAFLNSHQRTGEKKNIGIGREVMGLHKDKSTFPFRLAVSEVEYDERLIYTGFIHDISKEKAAEAKLKKYTQELEMKVNDRTKNLQQLISDLESARDEASISLEKEKELNHLKTRFVSMASHEFRTPLTSVQLSASLIDKYADMPDAENIHKHIGRIKESVNHLTGILNDFLSMEKLEAGNTLPQLKEFNIVEFSEELIEEMQILAKNNQNIIYQHTGIKSKVTLDTVLLKNSIINLVSNAIKYSGEDTLIEFNTELTSTELCITVKDNGIGIPEEEQKYLFEAFFRAHNTGDIPGTGLGLNIVKLYAELMGGEVLCKSGENLGTSITLRFKQ